MHNKTPRFLHANKILINYIVNFMVQVRDYSEQFKRIYDDIQTFCQRNRDFYTERLRQQQMLRAQDVSAAVPIKVQLETQGSVTPEERPAKADDISSYAAVAETSTSGSYTNVCFSEMGEGGGLLVRFNSTINGIFSIESTSTIS